jgi:HD-GYP domain-containing protein (c-di-GMP phosphodiesterase class II)
MMGFEERELRQLRRAALLHDLGKLSISNRILDKPEPLSELELARFRRHPLLTEQILAPVPGLGALAALASAHHERLDGSGYPRGLAADQLTTPMRVLAVADVYEALVSDRPYRPAYASKAALELMREEVPARLDPDAFAALRTLLHHWSFDAGLGRLTGGRSLRAV